MQRWKNSLFNIGLALNCLLVFLLLFENRLALPAWLQVAGRMHPLILHFPVVLIILYVALVIVVPASKIKNDPVLKNITEFLLLLAALSAVITALLGLFLSRETGYEAQTLNWHKWSGIVVSVFTLFIYYFREKMQGTRVVSSMTAVFALCLIVFTGHQGAGITHGQNFLLAPMLPEKKEPVIPIEDAEIYAHLVRPILEAKCISCHNSKKAKGELVMETEALLLKGGKDGVLWDSTAPDLGLLLRRIHLPIEEKKHMPPQGKSQLTEEEAEILTQWIRKGADFKQKVIALPVTDTLRQLAQAIFSEAVTASYDFEPADPATIRKLNTVNRVVTEESINSPALLVSFFNSQLFKTEQLKELSSIRKQIVSLDLAKMPVKDEDMKVIGSMENLRQLNLNFCTITGASLAALKQLKFLKTLSIAGMQVNEEQVRQLQYFPSLQSVFTWNIPVAAATMEKMEKEIKNIHFETGYKGDTTLLKLSPPSLQNEEVIFKQPLLLKLKHYIRGTVIRYTLDGSEPDSIHSAVYKDGQVIDGNVLVRAKAYKPGWISSDIMEASFFQSTYTPDTTIFITPPDPAYKGSSSLLTDLQKGGANFRNGSWMGWRHNKMETLMKFSAPVSAKSVTLSTLMDIGGYILPPFSIEIWGGNDPKQMRLLSKLTPPQPVKMIPGALKTWECKFNTASVSCIKIIAVPVAKLPKWHPGKGEKAWIFIDEVLIN